MISFRPGQQIKEFSILRKSTTLSEKGRVAKSEGEVIGTLKGTITAAKQTEQLKYGKQEHPSTHTVVVKRKTIARADDILKLNGRKFFVQGKDDPGELGIYQILYCEERLGV